MLSRDVTGLLGTGYRFLFRAKSCDQRGPSRGVGREEGRGRFLERLIDRAYLQSTCTRLEDGHSRSRY